MEKRPPKGAVNSAEKIAPFKFEKGKSGNPTGRPKVPPELRSRLRDLSKGVVEFWARVVNDETAELHNRLRAAENIYERAWGKPEQALDISGGLMLAPVDLSKLNSEQTNALIDALATVIDDGQKETDAVDY